jgi:hypothetical protein
MCPRWVPWGLDADDFFFVRMGKLEGTSVEKKPAEPQVLPKSPIMSAVAISGIADDRYCTNGVAIGEFDPKLA